MAPHDLRRPFKRPAISDQQRRRELAILRQSQHRSDSQNRARHLASSVFSLQSEPEPKEAPDPITRELDVVEASRLKGYESRRWFARQLMLPEWMIDVPPNLDTDWYVFPRPAGKRCFVVSSNGTTVSRLRNGSILHRFPSSLPCGAKKRDVAGPAHAYCILDCIFHEPDQTYYAIDMLCWRGYSLYDCSSEFRFFWLNSKLGETGACNPPSKYHKYRFNVVQIYECNEIGLHTAYTGAVPYGRDGLLFYNKHAHYQTGNTPLALVWKDEQCSQYLLDTDSKGHVPAQQQVVLELQDDGKLATSDEPPVVFGCIDRELQEKSGLQSGNLLRFAIKDEGVRLVDGKLEISDMQFTGKLSRGRAFADSNSKILFQYTARRSPVQFVDLTASMQSDIQDDSTTTDIEMAS